MKGISNNIPDIRKYCLPELSPLTLQLMVTQVREDVQEYISNMPEKRREQLYKLLEEKREESQ